MQYIDKNQLKKGIIILNFLLLEIVIGYIAIPVATNLINSTANQFNTNFITTEKLQK